MTPYVCDMGMAKVKMGMGTMRNRSDGARGTALYAAPETFKGECDKPADVWSLGCTLVELFSKKRMWNINTDNELMCLLLIECREPDLSLLDSEIQMVLKPCFNYKKECRRLMPVLLRGLERLTLM